MKKIKVDKTVYLSSKINKIKEDFEIIESIINFNQDEFIERVKEQMVDLGINSDELAQITYIAKERIKGILFYNVKLKDFEIKEITKKLHLT